jgi:hypothetical protein
MPENVLYEEPVHRPLKAYAFDPSRGRTLGNHMTIDVPYEKLEKGLSGKYLEVIDYDASNDCYYQPVDLNNPSVLIQGGLDPSESDPRFHQQMVYAVASKTISVFEFALGRKAKWGFNRNRAIKLPLRIYPHGMQDANAFYSRDLKAVIFGYFPASDDDPGTNLPGQTIFTCLSHDIIAHEMTHALIDGQRMHFMEASSPDTLAFHEGFADIAALFQHFSLKEVLLDVIGRTAGLIYRNEIAPDIKAENGRPTTTAEIATANPLVGLAKQFGEAMGQRAALREALGTPPNSNELEKKFEPHERGSILVAAVFDAFFTIYVRRVRDLLRIAGYSADGSHPLSGNLHPDLAERLAAEASKIAEHFCNICIRALDYSPPVDIRFGDFLRAIITADYDLVAEDPVGYRAAFIDAFQLRGIRPERVISYSEESVRWSQPEDEGGETLRCDGLDFDVFKPATRAQSDQNAKALYKFADKFRAELGLDPKLAIGVHSFHPTHRVGPDGQLRLEAVAELTQEKNVLVDPQDPTLGMMDFYGGVTLIIDLSADHEGEVRYAITKTITPGEQADARLANQREFFQRSAASFGLNVYSGQNTTNLPSKSRLNFSLIHRGY